MCHSLPSFAVPICGSQHPRFPSGGRRGALGHLHPAVAFQTVLLSRGVTPQCINENIVSGKRGDGIETIPKWQIMSTNKPASQPSKQATKQAHEQTSKQAANSPNAMDTPIFAHILPETRTPRQDGHPPAAMITMARFAVGFVLLGFSPPVLHLCATTPWATLEELHTGTQGHGEIDKTH